MESRALDNPLSLFQSISGAFYMEKSIYVYCQLPRWSFESTSRWSCVPLFCWQQHMWWRVCRLWDLLQSCWAVKSGDLTNAGQQFVSCVFRCVMRHRVTCSNQSCWYRFCIKWQNNVTPWGHWSRCLLNNKVGASSLGEESKNSTELNWLKTSPDKYPYLFLSENSRSRLGKMLFKMQLMPWKVLDDRSLLPSYLSCCKA